MPVGAFALALAAVAAATGWLDGTMRRLGLAPAAAAVAMGTMLAAANWHLHLGPLTVSAGCWLLPMGLSLYLVLRRGRNAALGAAATAAGLGAALFAFISWLPGEPAQFPLWDPPFLYAAVAGMASSLLARSPAGALLTATWGYGLAEAARAVALWRAQEPFSLVGGEGGAAPLVLAGMIAVVAAELVTDLRHMSPPRALSGSDSADGG